MDSHGLGVYMVYVSTSQERPVIQQFQYLEDIPVEERSNDLSDIGVQYVTRAQFDSVCALDNSHVIKKRTEIFRPKKLSNPFLMVSGYGCSACLAEVRSHRSRG